jgi:hypothetical protein
MIGENQVHISWFSFLKSVCAHAMMRSPATIIAALALVVLMAEGYYLPGIKPSDYQPHSRIEMLMGKMDSVKTQARPRIDMWIF